MKLNNAFHKKSNSSAGSSVRRSNTSVGIADYIGINNDSQLKTIVAGRKGGRVGDDETTVFKSVGLGVQDAATAYLAYRKAKEAGVGFEVEIFEKR